MGPTYHSKYGSLLTDIGGRRIPCSTVPHKQIVAASRSLAASLLTGYVLVRHERLLGLIEVMALPRYVPRRLRILPWCVSGRPDRSLDAQWIHTQWIHTQWIHTQ